MEEAKTIINVAGDYVQSDRTGSSFERSQDRL